MIHKPKKKSHLLEHVRLLISKQDEPDYKIAAMCGVAPSTVLNIRKGNHVPSVILAEHVYEILSGKSLGEFNL